MNDVPVVLKDLPTTARGFVTIGSDYEPVIILNARMSAEQQKKTYLHEIDHLVKGQLDDETYNEYGD